MIHEQLEEVRALVKGCLETSTLRFAVGDLGGCLDGGKMLRSRLLLRMGEATGVPINDRLHSGAAVELIHIASLLHDDVIDHGCVRRGKPAVWVEKGIKGAVLLGDLLMCRAISYLLQAGDSALIPRLTSCVEEMCGVEVEQELLVKERSPDWETCVDIARRKTGSLFAFAAEAAAGSQVPLQALLREAGYRLGTAYQLADDVLDAYGDPSLADKTLRADEVEGKVTAASAAAAHGGDPRRLVAELCDSARVSLSEWPEVQGAWDDYMAEDIGPVMNSFFESLETETVL